MRKHWLVTVLVLALVLSLAGCRLDDWKTGFDSWKEGEKVPLDLQETAGQDITLEKDSSPITVDLYFSRQDGKGLAVERRQIKRVEGIARETVLELLKGPQSKDLKAVIPKGTRLRDINLQADGICVIDLSRQVQDIANARQETLALYSLVNTVSQFPTVDVVTLLVEGQKVESIAGNTDLSEPVTADFNLAK